MDRRTRTFPQAVGACISRCWGVCGTSDDLPLLEELLHFQEIRENKAGLDALVACYLTLKEEWSRRHGFGGRAFSEEQRRRLCGYIRSDYGVAVPWHGEHDRTERAFWKSRSGHVPDEDTSAMLSELQRLIPLSGVAGYLVSSFPPISDEEAVDIAMAHRPFEL